MTNGTADNGWPPASAVVALGIIALIGAIAVSAILHYASVEDALKFWAALSGLLGLITGVFVTYFFTKGAVDSAQQNVQALHDANTQNQQTARQGLQALDEAIRRAQAQAEKESAKSDQKSQALAAVLGTISDPSVLDAAMQHPAVRAATGG